MREPDNLHRDVINTFKNELLIVFLRRLGGKVSIPLAEVDGTEGISLEFRIDENKVFHFTLEYKNG